MLYFHVLWITRKKLCDAKAGCSDLLQKNHTLHACDIITIGWIFSKPLNEVHLAHLKGNEHQMPHACYYAYVHAFLA